MIGDDNTHRDIFDVSHLNHMMMYLICHLNQ